MGHLLSSAIKMQDAVLPPPTLEIINNGGIFVSWEKNGISQGSVPIGVDVTLSYGDTIKVIASNPFDEGAIIEYYLDNGYVTTYSDITTAETPTISTFAGGEFKFDCYSGF
jgi:hypothetical protein